MIKAVIFDMDGLIVDTEPLLAKAVIIALKNQNLALTEHEYFEHWTKKGGNIRQFIQGKYIDFDFNRYRREKKEIFLSILKENVPLIRGVREKIQALRGRYLLALVSSSENEFIDSILVSTGLKRFFSVVIGSRDVKVEKPAPDGFLLAAERMNVKPEECVVLEDAEKGILAAKNANMKAIAIPNRYTMDNDFRKADQILSSISEFEI